MDNETRAKIEFWAQLTGYALILTVPAGLLFMAMAGAL